LLVNVPLGESPGSVACTLGTCGCDHHSLTQSLVRDVLPWVLLGVWSVGAGATVWVAWCRWVLFRRLMAHASPAPADWQSLAATTSDVLRRPDVGETALGPLPVLWARSNSRT
jgi:hypothetical protein